MMKQASSWSRLSLITFSFLIALVLSIIPMGLGLDTFRPDWPLLVLIFWVRISPQTVGFRHAFLLGLAVDVLLGSTYGVHSVTYTLVVYFMLRFYNQIRHMSMMNYTWTVMMLLALERGLNLVFEMHLHQVTLPQGYFWGVLTSTLIWPWLYALLVRIERRSGGV